MPGDFAECLKKQSTLLAWTQSGSEMKLVLGEPGIFCLEDGKDGMEPQR